MASRFSHARKKRLHEDSKMMPKFGNIYPVDTEIFMDRR